MKPEISIVLPVFNEDPGVLDRVIEQIEELRLPNLEILVVDDGSFAPVVPGRAFRLLRHPRNLGNGAAIKTGARNAQGKIIVFMDADGQHKASDIPRLLKKINEGYDMVVGARRSGSQASLGRFLANNFYNAFASVMTGHKIEDLTSGFRAVRATKFRKFLYLLPNGFSYPTTSTMAFFRSAYPVAYIPITVEKRRGSSNIKLLKDGLRFFIIILKIGALYSPMRLFLPISLLFFLLAAGYYGHTYFNFGRFTNMSALLFIASMFSFLIGILSEQISALHYRDAEEVSSSDEA